MDNNKKCHNQEQGRARAGKEQGGAEKKGRGAEKIRTHKKKDGDAEIKGRDRKKGPRSMRYLGPRRRKKAIE